MTGVWVHCPVAQSVLHNELGVWRTRIIDLDEDFYRQIAARFEVMDVERDAFEALQAVGPAYKHLDQIFDKLCRLVHQRYAAVADWGVQGRIELMKSWVENPPYPDQAPLGALGSAACVPSRGRQADGPARVKLLLAPSLLGPPSWAAIPFLLCHELICHVNQAAPMDSGDPFAEGWMDLIAQRLHNRWIDSVFPWAPTFARRCASELSYITTQRGQHLPYLHSTTRATRMLGHHAAQLTEGALRVTRPARPMRSSRALEHLSLQLNRVSATVPQRWSFVVKIVRLLDRRPEQMRRSELEQRTRLRACLQQWATGEISAREVLFFS